jgi:hypothetical protein
MRGFVVAVARSGRPPPCLAFFNAKPAWRKADDAAEGVMENDRSAMPVVRF